MTIKNGCERRYVQEKGELSEFEGINQSAFIQYNIKDNQVLYISDFEKNRCASENNGFHHGTELILYLLEHSDIVFTKIYGRLSWSDIQNKNWATSIPFYQDLPKYIYQRLGLQYEFHLYEEDECINDVTYLLQSATNRNESIQQFMKSHYYTKKNKEIARSASFCLKLI